MSTDRRHFSMIRGFQLADVLTLGNAACGTAAIFAITADGGRRTPAALLTAAALMVLALVFDILDGRVARARHSHSAMGRELDSLSDVISFGVAPAVMGFGAGLDGGWDRAILLAFVACGVSRLARYNVTAESLSAGGDKVKYFEGTPIPSSLVLVGVLAAAALAGSVGDALWLGVRWLGPFRIHPLSLMFAVSGAMMVSKTLRIPKL